ncbi:MAG TPA: discoidin domain-containing protein, partial [Chloroflexota bacterium]
EAQSAAEANAFLQRLRDSGLFASLEMSITGLETPGQSAQPTAGPALTPVPTAAVPTAQPTAVPAKPTPPPVQPPVVQPPVQPPAAAPPTQAPAKPQAQPTPLPQPTATLAPRTPLASPTPVGSPAAPAAAVSPLPQFDWVVQAKRETVFPDRTAPFSHIRVRAVDASGNLVAGMRVRVESEGSPAWADEYPHADHPASDGTFDLGVGMGKFSVFMLNGSSERATGLFTGVADQPGVHEWDVTFRKQTAGAVPSGPTCPGCTATPSPTPTLTVAPTATPISVGRNLASLACASASANNAGAPLAVDGNTDTAWESGVGPVVQITLDFTRWPNTDPRACQPKPPTEPQSVQVEALELVTRMSDRSRQTHEVWTVYDTGSAQLEYTFADVEATDNTTLSARFSATRTIKFLQIRTIRSGVNVGWREVRVFEPLPPAFGSVATSTPTGSATPVPTAPSNQLAFSSAQASSENGGNPALFAIDGDPSTFWRPVANPPSGQYLQLNFSVAQTVQTVRFVTAMGDAIATATATPNASTPTSTPAGSSFRVSLLRPTAAQSAQQARSAQDNDCYTQFVSADNATIQLSCSQPFTGVTGVRIILDSIGNPAVPPGIREVFGYAPGQSPTPTATGTATPTGVASPTPTDTATATVTPTRTPTPLEAATGAGAIASSEDTAGGHGAGQAVDRANGGAGPGQDPGTFWSTGAQIGPGQPEQEAWWQVQFNNLLNVDRVDATFYMLPAATVTVTFELRNANGTPIANGTQTVVNGTLLSDADARTASFSPRIQGVKFVRIWFRNLQAPARVGLRTVEVFHTPATSALAAFLSPLDRLLNVLAIRPAYAAPPEQAPAPTPVKPGLPGRPTPVVIGAPQQANAQLPPNPAGGQPMPTGRVAFLIVAQVRPGGA